MEAQQCVKLTGTNKPITYTTLIMCGLGEVSLEHCVFASTRRFSANNPTTPVVSLKRGLFGCVGQQKNTPVCAVLVYPGCLGVCS